MQKPDYEIICQPLYDFQRVSNGDVMEFFAVPAYVDGRGLSDTNLYHSNQLPGYQGFMVTGIGYKFLKSFPDAVRHGTAELLLGCKGWHWVSFNHGKSYVSRFDGRGFFIEPGRNFGVRVRFDRDFELTRECVLGIQLYGSLYRPVA